MDTVKEGNKPRGDFRWRSCGAGGKGVCRGAGGWRLKAGREKKTTVKAGEEEKSGDPEMGRPPVVPPPL